MTWQLDKGRPLCPQIGEQLCLQIALGVFKPHERLFSVREAAMAAGVNPNTVQHAFEQLEQQGILYSVRGSGWFVAEDVSLATQTLERLLAEKTAAYFDTMRALGLDTAKIKQYVKEWDE